MELTEEQLKEVLAGNTQGMSEEKALDNKDLYRKKQIEELKQQKDFYEQKKKEENTRRK